MIGLICNMSPPDLDQLCVFSPSIQQQLYLCLVWGSALGPAVHSSQMVLNLLSSALSSPVLSLHTVVHQSHGSPGGLMLSSTLCGLNTMSPHTTDKGRLNNTPPKKSLMEENFNNLRTVRP